MVQSKDMWAWISRPAWTARPPSSRSRSRCATRRDSRCRRGTCINVLPLKYTGPTFAAKGGGDVAMEELVLSSEGFEFAAV